MFSKADKASSISYTMFDKLKTKDSDLDVRFSSDKKNYNCTQQ